MRDAGTEILRLPALEVRQGEKRDLYSTRLPEFAAVSCVHRDGDAEIEGYQPPEVLAHIKAILRYIESDAPMIPNALVVAFDKRVRFEPFDGIPGTSYARHGARPRAGPISCTASGSSAWDS